MTLPMTSRIIRRARVVSTLLRIYPAAWRAEYGAELQDLLVSRPLDATAVVNVIASALRQRARYAEPSTVLGLPVMFAIAAGLVWNIVDPSALGGYFTVLKPSLKTLPTVAITPLDGNIYPLLQIACGAWTCRRHRGAARPGRAAVHMTVIACLPIFIAGVLMAAGMLPTIALTPAGVLSAPVLALPLSAIYGVIGGWLGRSREVTSRTV
jgi:hypothetical protein